MWVLKTIKTTIGGLGPFSVTNNKKPLAHSVSIQYDRHEDNWTHLPVFGS